MDMAGERAARARQTQPLGHAAEDGARDDGDGFVPVVRKGVTDKTVSQVPIVDLWIFQPRQFSFSEPAYEAQGLSSRRQVIEPRVLLAEFLGKIVKGVANLKG